MDSQPGDKSPGYYRVSIRDEGKTAWGIDAERPVPEAWSKPLLVQNGAKLSRIWDASSSRRSPEGSVRVSTLVIIDNLSPGRSPVPLSRCLENIARQCE
jgi:hypothetical protein